MSRNSCSTFGASPRRQRGLSLIALIFFGGIVVFLLVLGFKLIRPIAEYLAIDSTVNRIAREAKTVSEVRSAFERQVTIEDITSIRSQDLDITKEDDRIMVSYAYSYSVPVLDNVRLVIDFSGTTRDRPVKGGR